jgi:hypothetical protein
VNASAAEALERLVEGNARFVRAVYELETGHVRFLASP